MTENPLRDEDANDPLLTPAQIASEFKVVIRTINTWYRLGKLPGAFRTPGGSLRMRKSDVDKLTRPSTVMEEVED